MSKGGDELAKLGGGQRPIYPAIAVGQIRVVIVTAQNGFQGAAAADQARVYNYYRCRFGLAKGEAKYEEVGQELADAPNNCCPNHYPRGAMRTART
jgi:hypothetical protein